MLITNSATQHERASSLSDHDRLENGSRNIKTTQYVTFYVSEQLFGIPVESVQEVLNPQTIAIAPKSPPEFAGLINLRGQIVTAVDLRVRLGLPRHDQDSMNVVINDQKESFSLLVDQVGDVIDLNDKEMMAVPRTLDAEWKQLSKGIFRLEKQLLIILNIQHVLSI